MAARRGVLIALEGLSGAGKTRAAHALAENLALAGMETVIVQWNSVQLIRRISSRLAVAGLLSPVPYALLSWIACAIQFLGQVKPALRRGKVVIADRYIHTAYTRDAMNGVPAGVSRALYGLFPDPDCVLFVTLSPRACWLNLRMHHRSPIFHRWRPGGRGTPLCRDDLAYLEELYRRYQGLFTQSALQRQGRVFHLGADDLRSDPGVLAAPAVAEEIERLHQETKRYAARLSDLAGSGLFRAVGRSSAPAANELGPELFAEGSPLSGGGLTPTEDP